MHHITPQRRPSRTSPARYRSMRRTGPPVPPRFLHKPLLGGPWGVQGRYRLATAPRVERGLHHLTHLVLDVQGGTVLAIADGKAEALQTARRAVHAVAIEEHRAALQAAAEAGQAELWPEQHPPGIKRRRRPSRRRRQILEASGGRCFYCRVKLDPEAFHIEHMLPRALDGDDRPPNLVAACAGCNLAKRDRTAVEFALPR